jgi:quinol monooxygenase YgiN
MARTDQGHEVAWVLELAVNPGQFDAVWALMEEMVASTRDEPGALGYAWFVGEENRTVALYERYADSAAVLDHLATFGERFAPRFLAAMAPSRLTVFGDPSEEARQALAGFNPTYLGFLGGFTDR